MSQPSARKISLSDLMMLVAMTGLGLSCYVFVDDALFRGQRYIFGLFDRPLGGWDSIRVIERVKGVFGFLLPLLGAWALALPVLRLRKPRPAWRRLNRQPGFTACIAALAGMAFCAGVAGLAVLLRWWVDGQTQLGSRFWYRTPVLDDLIIYAGVSVAGVWATQIVTGRWRKSADWIDRLGRFLGGLWVAAALVFSTRFMLG